MIYNTLFFLQKVEKSHQDCTLENKKFLLLKVCELAKNFDDFSIRTVIKRLSEIFELPENIIKNYINGKENKIDGLEQLISYLKFEFIIKQDSISKEIFIRKDEIEFTKAELKLHLISKGFDLKNNVLNEVLAPENKQIRVIKSFNPIKEKLKKYASEYDGTTVISKLSNLIIAENFDNETGFYQEKLNYLFRKWLYMAAGQMMGLTINTAVFNMISGQGQLGKSRLAGFLFSVFNNQHTLTIGENSTHKNFTEIGQSKSLLFLDEFPIKPTIYDSFKFMITADELEIYNKKLSKHIKKARTVNVMTATNHNNRKGKDTFLKNNDGGILARLIPIEITKINYEEYTDGKINPEDIWREAAATFLQIYNSGKKEDLSWKKDIPYFEKENQKYLRDNITNTNRTITDYFPPAMPNEGSLLSTPQMIELLSKNDININMNKLKLGWHLRGKGYKKKRIHGLKGWWVKNNINT